ncbi:MAG: HPr family phosphocarrier protein [Fibrobacteria bacterium]|nr:HPr family phosphocarrier protein [Fibrobacteria bacterium]
MISEVTHVKNKAGIHARPAVTIVETAGLFSSEIFIIKDGVRANAKSILNILSLAASCGTEIVLEVEGEDEAKALSTMLTLFENEFHVDKEADIF